MTVLDLLRPLTPAAVQQRAAEYTKRIRDIGGDATSVWASVRGTTTYDVELSLQGDMLVVFCSCPYFADHLSVCKHLWATAVVTAQSGWLTHLPNGVRVAADQSALADFDFVSSLRDADLESGPRQPAAAPPRYSSVPQRAPAAPRVPDWARALAELTPRDDVRPVMPWAGSQFIYVISAPPGATLTELPLNVERLDRKKNGEWSKPQPSRLTYDMIPHLPDPEDRWALSLMHASSTYPRSVGTYGYGLASQPLGANYLRAALVNTLLPRLCATGRVRLRPQAGPYGSSGTSDQDVTLSWDDGAPWRFTLTVRRTQDDDGPAAARDAYEVDAILEREHTRATVREFALLTDSIAVRDGAVSRFEPCGGMPWATYLRRTGPLVVPVESRAELVDALARSGIEHARIPPELQWEERTVPPRFRVNLGAPERWNGQCAVHAEVEYESVRAPLANGARLTTDEGRVVYRRDGEAEREALTTLKRLGVSGLEAHAYQGPAIHERRVTALVDALVAQGWAVEAEGVRYRAIAAPRLRIRSGIDWFELDAADEGSDTPIDAGELVRALSTGQRTVRLGDGTIGMLPQDWLAQVAPALSLGDVQGGAVRFKPSQVALLDALLATQPTIDWDEGFRRARAALSRFEGVRAEDPAPTFTGALRDYQREALGWMRFLREFGFGGCLADDMGLGKTVMVLAMLDARRHDTTRTHRPSLIVVPRSLLFNWTHEAERFTPALRVLDFAHADRHTAIAAIGDADLVLTTYGTLRRDVALLQDQRFDYVVLDESQAIKNAGTATAKAVRLLHADHRLALTGTPVENHLGELQSLFDFLNPGLLGRGKLFKGALDSREQVSQLARGLRPFFLRRTKEQVAPELPARTDETLYCELEGDQRKVYDSLRAHYRQSLLKMIDRQGLAKSKMHVLEALLRLRQAACHTGLLGAGNGRGVAPRSRSAEALRFRQKHPLRLTPHGHVSAKFDVLLPRLGELIAEGRKALVFSQFTSLLALLRDRLDGSGIVYEYLDGQTTDRGARVERFQSDAACPLFLISLKAGGVGLNLTAAEYVFLLDPWWNPAVEMQAIDRTHRIGQQKPVFAYRIVARDTVEERILELQSRKRELADAVLEAGAGGLRGLQREDLEQLLA